jgi:hypothetical protein
MMEYDENDAIDFIINKLDQEIADDEILNIIDIIWDYYEDNGYLEISIDDLENEGTQLNDLVAHVIKVIMKDKSSTLDNDVITKIVEAEVEYEESLDIF